MQPSNEVIVRLTREDAWWLRGRGIRQDEEPERRLRVYGELDRALASMFSNGSAHGLDGPGQSRSDDVPTAKVAAATLGKPGNKRRAVLQAIIDAGTRGLTSEEAVARTGIEYRTLTPRVGELKRWGYIEAKDGVTREGTHGAQQQVLLATDFGLREMRAAR